MALYMLVWQMLCMETKYSEPYPDLQVGIGITSRAYTQMHGVSIFNVYLLCTFLLNIKEDILRLHAITIYSPLSAEVIYIYVFNCMFYQLLHVQYSSSSTQSWGSVLPSIVETRDQNSRGSTLLFSNRNLGSICA